MIGVRAADSQSTGAQADRGRASAAAASRSSAASTATVLAAPAASSSSVTSRARALGVVPALAVGEVDALEPRALEDPQLGVAALPAAVAELERPRRAATARRSLRCSSSSSRLNSARVAPRAAHLDVVRHAASYARPRRAQSGRPALGGRRAAIDARMLCVGVPMRASRAGRSRSARARRRRRPARRPSRPGRSRRCSPGAAGRRAAAARSPRWRSSRRAARPSAARTTRRSRRVSVRTGVLTRCQCPSSGIAGHVTVRSRRRAPARSEPGVLRAVSRHRGERPPAIFRPAYKLRP